MGTNYYRIPSHEEMLDRKELLITRAQDLDISASNIACEFRTIKKMDMSSWEAVNLWERFTGDMIVHIGKRSGGWKFLWNFNKNMYYKDKEELFQFLRSGRIVNEYSEELDVEEFIKMALEWGQPDGLIFDEDYEKTNSSSNIFYGPKYWDRLVDGLRVSSSTEFS
jgi:hypothetical protein